MGRDNSACYPESHHWRLSHLRCDCRGHRSGSPSGRYGGLLKNKVQEPESAQKQTKKTVFPPKGNPELLGDNCEEIAGDKKHQLKVWPVLGVGIEEKGGREMIKPAQNGTDNKEELHA